MEDRIRLKILTASGAVLDERVSYVALPGAGGSVGVLPNHAPMLCALGSGRLTARLADGAERIVFVSGGVAGVENNEITVLAAEARIGE